jgi:hypothetical protein
MSSPYPWIKDSQYGTTPSVTNYLQVTSPNGLYLNDTNSKVLLSSPTTNEKLTINKSSIDFVNTNGTSALLIDNTKIHLNEPSPSATPFTTDITYQNIILQSKNSGTPTYTLTLRPNLIQHLTPNFSMVMGTGTYQTQALSVPRTSSLNTYVFSLGFDGGTYQGKLYCLNIDCATDIKVLTINGLSSFPITTGLIWADFANPYSSLPSNRYYLTDTTFETYQDVQQFYAKNMSGNQSASYNWNGINTTGAFTLQTNGYNFDLYCSTFNINGIPYSPGGGGGVSDIQAGSGISVNQNTGSVTISNSGVTDIQAGPGISISQTTGSVTISNSGGGGGENLNTTLSYGNDAGNQDINNVNNINVNSINGSSYPPSVSVPQFIFAMPFQSGNVDDNNQTLFTSGVYITGGFTYAITWTFWYDGLYQSGGGVEMIHGYSDLSSISGSVVVQGAAKSTGLWASSYISTASGSGSYKTTLTYTDNNYVINTSDTYYPYVFQNNTLAWGGTTYVSATISRTN